MHAETDNPLTLEYRHLLSFTLLGLLAATVLVCVGCGSQHQTIDLPPNGFIEVEGAKLNYKLVGEGTPLVVVPGGPGFGYDYLAKDLTPLLADSYQLLYYDQRGCGHSTGIESPENLTMLTFAHDLERIRKAAGLEALNLLGHSFGGLLAMNYAVMYADRVESLILLDSDPASWEMWNRFRPIVETRRSEKDKASLAEIEAREGWSLDPETVEHYYRITLRPYFARQNLADRLNFGFDEQMLGNRLVTYDRIREDLGRWDIHDELSRIASPSLVIYGEATIFPEEAGKRIHERLPYSKLVRIPGAGHFPHVEAPQEFVKAIRSFLP